MMERRKMRRRLRCVVLLWALVAFAPRAGADVAPATGFEQDGWVRAVRYASCALGAFMSTVRMDGAVLTQSLMFCAQLLSEESD